MYHPISSRAPNTPRPFMWIFAPPPAGGAHSSASPHPSARPSHARSVLAPASLRTLRTLRAAALRAERTLSIDGALRSDAADLDAAGRAPSAYGAEIAGRARVGVSLCVAPDAGAVAPSAVAPE